MARRSIAHYAGVFVLLCAFRLLNVTLVRSYFDPDEFWQTLEPAYCSVFYQPTQDCPGYTWEWKRQTNAPSNLIADSLLGPARTYLNVLPTHIFYRVVQMYGWDSSWMIARGPMVVAALMVGAPTDMAIYYAASMWLPEAAGWCLFCSLTGWFHAFTLVRTLANGQESLFLILAICLVGPELLISNQKQTTFHNNNQKDFVRRSSLAFFLGGLSVSIRFTAIAAFVPMGVLLAGRQPSRIQQLVYLFHPCAVWGVAGILVAMCVDYFKFGFLTIPFLGNFHFNVILDYADLYGSHPWHWYFTTAMPVVSGLLLPFVLTILLRGNLTHASRNLLIIVGVYLAALSNNAHKEFRYILPVLPVVCLLVGANVGSFLKNSRTRIFVWIVANGLVLVYLGCFHQSGSISVNQKILEFDKSGTVQYLTGGCHTTPLLAHLHSKTNTMRVKHLDCSPTCRADPDLVCEYLQFHENPVEYMTNEFFDCNDDQECTPAQAPDFVVTMSDYLEISNQLNTLGLQEVARFPQTIQGLRVKGRLLLGNDDEFHGHYRLGSLEVVVQEMVLFAKP